MFLQAMVQNKLSFHLQCRLVRPHHLQITYVTLTTATIKLSAMFRKTGYLGARSIALQLQSKISWTSCLFFCFSWRIKNISIFWEDPHQYFLGFSKRPPEVLQITLICCFFCYHVQVTFWTSSGGTCSKRIYPKILPRPEYRKVTHARIQ